MCLKRLIMWVYNDNNDFRPPPPTLFTEVTHVRSKRRKTRTCETSMVGNTNVWQLDFVVEEKSTWPCEMKESRHYPSPDFTRPPPDFIQPFLQQQQPRTSSFQPSMWSWAEAPTEPGWDSAWAGWQNGAAAGVGFSSHHGNYGPRRPYGKLYIHLYSNITQCSYQWHRPVDLQMLQNNFLEILWTLFICIISVIVKT